jgi:hypothetical protein
MPPNEKSMYLAAQRLLRQKVERLQLQQLMKVVTRNKKPTTSRGVFTLKPLSASMDLIVFQTYYDLLLLIQHTQTLHKAHRCSSLDRQLSYPSQRVHFSLVLPTEFYSSEHTPTTLGSYSEYLETAPDGCCTE